MPVRHVLVRDSGCDIEHDDTTLALNIVSITEPAELLLSSSIPDVKYDGAKIGGERQGVYFDTKGGFEDNDYYGKTRKDRRD